MWGGGGGGRGEGGGWLKVGRREGGEEGGWLDVDVGEGEGWVWRRGWLGVEEGV